MKSIEQIVERAEQHCRRHGSRLTHKRKQVLSGLLRSDKALSAYELIDVCEAESGETMPAMSMYRILEFLRKESLVHKLDLANKYIACSHIACDHDHDASQFLICDRCQKVKEIRVSESTVAGLRTSIEHAGFHLLTPQFEINCVCDDCAEIAG